jgi:hypothetical protein
MVLIEKHYRGFLSRTVSDQFWKEASTYKSLRDAPPVIQKDKYVLAHVQVRSSGGHECVLALTACFAVEGFGHLVCD